MGDMIVCNKNMAAEDLCGALKMSIEHMRDNDVAMARSESAKNLKRAAYDNILRHIASIKFVETP